jgi:hypothetical protein
VRQERVTGGPPAHCCSAPPPLCPRLEAGAPPASLLSSRAAVVRFDKTRTLAPCLLHRAEHPSGGCGLGIRVPAACAPPVPHPPPRPCAACLCRPACLAGNAPFAAAAPRAAYVDVPSRLCCASADRRPMVRTSSVPRRPLAAHRCISQSAHRRGLTSRARCSEIRCGRAESKHQRDGEGRGQAGRRRSSAGYLAHSQRGDGTPLCERQEQGTKAALQHPRRTSSVSQRRKAHSPVAAAEESPRGQALQEERA